MMFDPQDTARVYKIPIGCDFSTAFVTGVLESTKCLPPHILGRTQIFVNTNRMGRSIHSALLAHGARFLPKIRLITDVPNLPDLPIGLPPPVTSMRRTLQLAQLVGALLEQEPSFGAQSSKYDLAQSLAGLMDELQGAGVPLSKLREIEVSNQSGHWENSLKFINILADHWDQSAPRDPQDRLRSASLSLAEKWQEQPAEHPILVAGSTGSREAAAIFMRAVSKLPQGAVILPGVDGTMAANDWAHLRSDGVGLDHPQAVLDRFCKSLGLSPAEIEPWGDIEAANPARNRVISLALRPAPFTDQWMADGPKLQHELLVATDAVSVIEADTPRLEALAIALRLRKAAEDTQKAVLISPDRTLTRQVAATLNRWGILADDSAGRPLHLTPPALLFRLILKCYGKELTPQNLVSVLKHPMFAKGSDDGESRLFTRDFEQRFLRGKAPDVTAEMLHDWAAKDTENPRRRIWADWIFNTFNPLQANIASTLQDHLDRLRHTAERLVSGPFDGLSQNLWEKEDGEALDRILKALHENSDVAGTLSTQDFTALLETFLRSETVREPRETHAHIAIWGAQEARVQSADLVILGGLNDAIWPGQETPDPWLSRGMRAQLGLAPPERVTGLSAHDFQQAVAAPEVILSRAIRDGEAPTVGSRWLVRIFNLLGGLKDEGPVAMEAMQSRGKTWLDLAKIWDQPTMDVPPEPRPAPRPPIAARPKKLSVTQIETLIRDPYSIYAKKVLDLYKLDPLGRAPDALMKGIALHNLVEKFITDTKDNFPPDAEAVFMKTAVEVLTDEVPWPAERQLWIAKLSRVAAWFVETERERRKLGTVVTQERLGERTIPDLDFTLSAQVDRIDRVVDESLRIYDYKSGQPPTPAQTKVFNKQLQLEAAIAEVGGFDTVAAAPVSALEYIGMSGKNLGRVGKIQEVDLSDMTVAAFWAEFCELIAAFHQATRGYVAHARMESVQYDYDYDHLARLGEWQTSDTPDPKDVP